MWNSIRKWFRNKFTVNGRLHSIYEKVDAYEYSYKQLANSERTYKKLYVEFTIYEQILEVLIGLSNAIATGCLKDDQIEKMTLALHKIFGVTEIYYARIKEGKFIKRRSYVCPDHIEVYYPKMEGNISELPEYMDYILRKECYQIDNNEFPYEEKKYYSKLGIKSVYGCPVVVDNELYGLVGFNKIESTAWKRYEISICNICASLVSTAIKKQHLLRDLAQANKRILEYCIADNEAHIKLLKDSGLKWSK